MKCLIDVGVALSIRRKTAIKYDQSQTRSYKVEAPAETHLEKTNQASWPFGRLPKFLNAVTSTLCYRMSLFLSVSLFNMHIFILYTIS